MITVVSGKIGRGKSYWMTTRIVRHLISGGVVATNMKIDLDWIRETWKRRIFSWQLVPISAEDDPRKIPRGDFRGESSARRVMVVLDEALNWFASQGGAKDDRKATWGEYLRQSDKLGQDVYMVAQNFERAAKWIRELAQIAINITAIKDLSVLRIPIGRLPGLRNLFSWAAYDVNSGMVLEWHLGSFDKRYYRAYKTAELYGFEASVNGYLASVPPAFRLPFWPFVFPLVAVVLGVVYAFRSAS